jgi:hypothetical protein
VAALLIVIFRPNPYVRVPKPIVGLGTRAWPPGTKSGSSLQCNSRYGIKPNIQLTGSLLSPMGWLPRQTSTSWVLRWQPNGGRQWLHWVRTREVPPRLPHSTYCLYRRQDPPRCVYLEGKISSPTHLPTRPTIFAPDPIRIDRPSQANSFGFSARFSRCEKWPCRPPAAARDQPLTAVIHFSNNCVLRSEIRVLFESLHITYLSFKSPPPGAAGQPSLSLNTRSLHSTVRWDLSFYASF